MGTGSPGNCCMWFICTEDPPMVNMRNEQRRSHRQGNYREADVAAHREARGDNGRIKDPTAVVDHGNCLLSSARRKRF